MKKLIIFVMLVGFLTAQGGPGKGPGKMWERLGVDEDTQEKIQDIHMNKMKEKQRLHIAMQKKQLELKEILLEDLDMAAVKANTDERAVIWAKMQMLDFETDLEIKKLLDDDQWEKYLTMRMMMRQHKQGGGKGGHKGGKGPR